MTARQDIEKLIACLGPEPIRVNSIPPTPWLLRQDRADRITRASVWPGGFARGRESASYAARQQSRGLALRF